MIHPNMPAEKYRAAPGVSQSALKVIGEEGGPARAKYGDPRAETQSQKFGTLIHMAVLQPYFLETCYMPTDLKRVGTKAWDEAEASAMGRTLVKRADYDEARRISDSLQKRSSLARELLKPSPQLGVEQAFFWTDPRTGLACKGLADLVHTGYRVLADLKSTVDAREDAFRLSCRRWGYGIQAEWYDKGYPLAGGFVPDAFIHIVVEKTSPWLSRCYEIDREESLAEARVEISRMMDIWKECERTQTWPGYDDSLQTLKL